MLIPPRVLGTLLEAGIVVRPVTASSVDIREEGGDPFVVEVVRRSAPLSPSHVRRLGTTGRGRLLLVVPSASPAAMEAADAAGISVITDGEDPLSPVIGRIIVSDRTTQLLVPRPRRSTTSRRGPRPWGTLTIIRHLLTHGPTTQAALAEQAAVTQARVSQVLTGLAADGFVRRSTPTSAHRWDVPDWDLLLDHWITMYSGPQGLTSYWYGLDEVTDQARTVASLLHSDGVRVGVSGDVAADFIAPWRRPRRAVLYTDPPGNSTATDLTRAGLVPAVEDDATLELHIPADPGLWVCRPDSQARSPLPLVNELQVLWDLQRSSGSDTDQAVNALRTALRPLAPQPAPGSPR